MNSHPSNRSTGPITPEGNAISCLNATKHGLTGAFCVHQSESQELFDELRDALRAEHQPATSTEILLVDRMAEHAWLAQRAQRMGDAALSDLNPTWFALMLRYQTSHDRAFHKCLAELRAIRRERAEHQKTAREFESQNAKMLANARLLNARAAELELKTTLKSNVHVAHSNLAPIPFREIQEAVTVAVKQWAAKSENPVDQAAA